MPGGRLSSTTPSRVGQTLLHGTQLVKQFGRTIQLEVHAERDKVPCEGVEGVRTKMNNAGVLIHGTDPAGYECRCAGQHGLGGGVHGYPTRVTSTGPRRNADTHGCIRPEG